MIWFGTPWPIRSEEIDCQNIKKFIRFLLIGGHNSLNKDDSICSAARIFDLIWKTRNNLLFRQVLVDPTRIQSEFYTAIFSEMRTCKLASNFIRDPNPGEPFLKNSEGRISRVAFKHDVALNALDAELKAIHLALVSAKEQRWNIVLILSDAEVAVKALSNGKGPPDWRSLESFLAAQDKTFVRISVILLVSILYQEQRML
ncbi:hypothetical protein TorRG33x02_162650 [Trema orientale]|uniref:RNase H type-1 domain-containing protein n=1 Tax=Trema orientale TaxID=63057 RepID=A0A2P5EQS7_TREOI|nr:hypothetical protein TorRG33x02_162650 [Trema orientale]